MDTVNNETEELGLEYLAAGRRLFLERNLADAAFLLEKAATTLHLAKSHKNYCEAMNILGVVTAGSGNDSLSMDYYLGGLDCAIRHKLKVNQISILNNIGSRYQQLGAYERSLDFLLRSEKLFSEVKPEDDPRLKTWEMAMNMNIANSYRCLGDLDKAKEYMDKVGKFDNWEEEDENSRMFLFAFKLTEAMLKWDLGEKVEVKAMVPKLKELAMKDGNASDYVINIREFTSILKKTNEKSIWEDILISFEKNAASQETIYYKLISVENWLDYYRFYNMESEYKEACVEYTELSEQMKAITDRERVDGMDLKVTLHEKDTARRKYERMANIDALTGLGNRNKMEQDTEPLMQWARMDHHFLGVGFFDLDHFKEKNDTYGHIVGDACINCLVRAVERTFGSTDNVYRFGGDEFVVVIPDATNEILTSYAINLKKYLANEQKNDIRLKNVTRVTVSQGYACGIPEVGDTIIDLIKSADKALYQVKESGRDGFHIFGYEDINRLKAE